ncbi:MAG: LicD family protein [Christensenella sp.]|uniref:LicD family protein n=1 Tax=Christensenella sp. TaxID=1935934 RepID=UPI002B1EE7C7|nr:LicD family protein [Christensenella sp.]MEA5002893.1 LicD family protein [Christensenella sp.]
MANEYDPQTLKRVQGVILDIFKDFKVICEKHGIPYFAFGGTAIGAIRHHGFIPWDDDIDVCMLREDYERFLTVAPGELDGKYDLLTIENTDGYVLPFAKLSKKGTVFLEATDTNRTYTSGIFLDIFPFDVLAADEQKRAKQIKKAWFWARMCVMQEYGEVKLPGSLVGAKRSAASAAVHMVHGVLKLFHVSKASLYRRYLKATRMYEDVDDTYVTDFSGIEPEKIYFAKSDLFPLQEMPFEDTTISMPRDPHPHLTLQFGDYMTLPPEEDRKNHYPAVLKFGDE